MMSTCRSGRIRDFGTSKSRSLDMMGIHFNDLWNYKVGRNVKGGIVGALKSVQKQ